MFGLGRKAQVVKESDVVATNIKQQVVTPTPPAPPPTATLQRYNSRRHELVYQALMQRDAWVDAMGQPSPTHIHKAEVLEFLVSLEDSRKNQRKEKKAFTKKNKHNRSLLHVQTSSSSPPFSTSIVSTGTGSSDSTPATIITPLATKAIGLQRNEAVHSRQRKKEQQLLGDGGDEQQHNPDDDDDKSARKKKMKKKQAPLLPSHQSHHPYAQLSSIPATAPDMIRTDMLPFASSLEMLKTLDTCVAILNYNDVGRRSSPPESDIDAITTTTSTNTSLSPTSTVPFVEVTTPSNLTTTSMIHRADKHIVDSIFQILHTQFQGLVRNAASPAEVKEEEKANKDESDSDSDSSELDETNVPANEHTVDEDIVSKHQNDKANITVSEDTTSTSVPFLSSSSSKEQAASAITDTADAVAESSTSSDTVAVILPTRNVLEGASTSSSLTLTAAATTAAVLSEGVDTAVSGNLPPPPPKHHRHRQHSMRTGSSSSSSLSSQAQLTPTVDTAFPVIPVDLHISPSAAAASASLSLLLDAPPPTDFISRLKHPKAADIVELMRSFFKNFAEIDVPAIYALLPDPDAYDDIPEEEEETEAEAADEEELVNIENTQNAQTEEQPSNHNTTNNNNTIILNNATEAVNSVADPDSWANTLHPVVSADLISLSSASSSSSADLRIRSNKSIDDDSPKTSTSTPSSSSSSSSSSSAAAAAFDSTETPTISTPHRHKPSSSSTTSSDTKVSSSSITSKVSNSTTTAPTPNSKATTTSSSSSSSSKATSRGATASSSSSASSTQKTPKYKGPSPADRARAFLTRVEETLRSHILWRNDTTAEQWEETAEQLEKFVMCRIFDQVFAAHPACIRRDSTLSKRMQSLSFITFGHLDLAEPSAYLNPGWKLAQAALRDIDRFKSPGDKLACIMNACRIVSTLLTAAADERAEVKRKKEQQQNGMMMKNSGDGSGGGGGGGSNSSSSVGADEFLPALIYTVLHAQPPNLYSSLRYIGEFRNPSKLMSEQGYFYTNVLSAVAFAKRVKPEQLSMTQAEFKLAVKGARARAESQREYDVNRGIGSIATARRMGKFQKGDGPAGLVAEDSDFASQLLETEQKLLKLRISQAALLFAGFGGNQNNNKESKENDGNDATESFSDEEEEEVEENQADDALKKKTTLEAPSSSPPRPLPRVLPGEEEGTPIAPRVDLIDKVDDCDHVADGEDAAAAAADDDDDDDECKNEEIEEEQRSSGLTRLQFALREIQRDVEKQQQQQQQQKAVKADLLPSELARLVTLHAQLEDVARTLTQ